MGRNARRRHPTKVSQAIKVRREQHPAYGWNRPQMRAALNLLSIEELKARFMPAKRLPKTEAAPADAEIM